MSTEQKTSSDNLDLSKNDTTGDKSENNNKNNNHPAVDETPLPIRDIPGMESEIIKASIEGNLRLSGTKEIQEREDGAGSGNVYRHDINEIKKILQLPLRKAGEEVASDNDRILQYMIKKDVEHLSKKKFNYEYRTKVYIDGRINDPEYIQLNTIPNLGKHGAVEEVAHLSHEISWKETTKPHGPLWKKRYIEWKKNLPTGPSQEEIQEARGIRGAKLLWAQIQADAVPDNSKAAQILEETKKKKQEEEKLKHSAETREENLKVGKFELTRTKPTRAEYITSLKAWSKAIYMLGLWDTVMGFPVREGIDSHIRPTALTIKEEIEYNRYVKKQNTELYVDANGDIHQEFSEHMVKLRIKRSRDFLDRERIRKDKEARDRKLKVKLELRKKKRAEEAAAAEAKAKEEAEAEQRRKDEDRDRREELLIVASELLVKQAEEMNDKIAIRTKGRKLVWIKPKEQISVEDMVEELLQKEKEEAKELERLARVAEEDELAEFRKTWKGKIQTISTSVKNLSRSMRLMTGIKTQDELEEEELDRLEAELEEEEARAKEQKQIKFRQKQHEGLSNRGQRDLSNAFQSKKGKKKKIKGITGLVKHMSGKLRDTFNSTFGLKLKGKTKTEQRMAKKQRKEAMEQFNEEMDRRIVEAIFTARKKAKESESTLKQMRDAFRGGSEEEFKEYFLPDLINAAKGGDFNRCIDIMEHPNTPVDPNEYDEGAEGTSATYAAIMAMIDGEDSQNENDKKTAAMIDGRLTIYQRIIRYFRKKEAAARLEFAVKILLHKGGDIDFVRSAKGEEGYGVLHVACERGLLNIVKWLIKKGADPNLETKKYHKTPLMLAAAKDHIEVMLYLLEHGAMYEVNKQDFHGNSALHYSAINGKAEHAQVLLLCGAKNLRNKIGRSATEEAKSRNRMEMYEKVLYYKENDDEHVQRLLFLEEGQKDNSEVASE